MYRRYLTLALFAAVAYGQTSSDHKRIGEGELIFQKTVAATLHDRCGTCHGPSLQSSNLRLDSREAILKGGVRGPAVVPGNPDGSLLLTAIQQSDKLKMPPAAKLPEATIAAIRRWIELGAPWSEHVAEAPAAGDATWAFQPLTRPADFQSIDQFINARLAEKPIAAAHRADRRTLIRRATYDLWGLSPSPAEIDSFVEDPAPDQKAFATLVDRLLASTYYGERWGRHWLDVVRYADTGGFSNDFERPHAWRYRDYGFRCENPMAPV